MPVNQDISCPFCGARFRSGASACPACDLPILGENGEHPAARASAPFDGAALFDEAFPEEIFTPVSRGRPQPLLAQSRRAGDETMRCLVVAMNQAEADMLSDMLRAEGVPCMVRPSALQSYVQTAARCEVLVPEFALSAARELLRIDETEPEFPGPRPAMIAAAIVAGLIAIAAIVGLLMVLS
ncbi:MAG: DUF2007 domain-containing protein [Solirubrobacterales bacterium]